MKLEEFLKTKNEVCMRDPSIRYINPIIDWEESDVWDFIHQYNVPYCSLYDEGWKRIGCVGCPMGSGQKRELTRYPKIAQAYKNAMGRAIISEKRGPSTMFKDVDDYYDWWISGRSAKEWAEKDTEFWAYE